ncbi:MAG: glycosyltransferase family 39 protein [Candidatus Pacebacteria bacterium]|nr:glycosyltransferase family 39 protein [Candidatus Paceibacterota bacterium]
MKKITIFLLLVIIGFLIRVYNYYHFPVFGETADEWAWTMLGASLIQEKIPASWSYFTDYEDKYIYKTGVYDAPIVRPAFDHPPLFSLLPGLAQSFKAHWLDFPSAKLVRFPMILLGALNVGLFWLVVDRFFSKKKFSLLATTLFITIPTLVFGSRLVVAENLLVTWTILAYCAVFNLDKKWSTKLVFILSLLAVLTKVAGLVIPVSILAYAFLEKNWKLFKASLFGLLVGISLFFIYGAIYDFSLFLKLLSSQSTRDLSFVTLQNRLFIHPVVIRHLLFDGWKILGFFASILMLANKDKKYLFLNITFLINLVFILFSVGGTTYHGWYDYLLWPTLIINLVELIKLIQEKRLWLLAGMTWLLLLPLFNLAFLKLNLLESLSTWSMRGIFSIGFLPVLFESLNLKKLSKFIYFLILLLLIVTNIFVALTMDATTYWNQAAFFDVNNPLR